ncbi:hypothetical protein C0J52_22040 [Blattella germanica]|nr:hypothetical protein C0J52_22040 [Blattella germanica]
MLGFPPNKCRLCGLNKSQGFNVYSISAKREGLLTKITKRLSKEVVHIVIGDGLPKFVCMDCERIVSNFSDFCNMVQNKEPSATVHIGPDGKVECVLCQTYLDTEHTTLHMVTHGIGTIICRCRACGHQGELAQFLRTNTGSDVGNTVWCSNCHFLSPTKLKRTTNKSNTQHRNKINICEICSKTFRTSGHLVRHRLIHSGAKPYLCEVCGTGFSQRSSLKQHVLSHAGVNPHKCPHCGQTFRFKVSLKSHIITLHGSPTPVPPSKSTDYGCDRCGKQFATAYKLGRHYRSHTGERPYECNRCGKLFSQTGNLNLHRKKHKEEDAAAGCLQPSTDFDNSIVPKNHLSGVMMGKETEAYGVQMLPDQQQTNQQVQSHEAPTNNGQYLSESSEVLVNAHDPKFLETILQHPVVPCDALGVPTNALSSIDTVLLNSAGKVSDHTSQFVTLNSEYSTASTHIAPNEYLSTTNSATGSNKPIEHKNSTELFTHFSHEGLLFIDQPSELEETTSNADSVPLPTFSSLQSGTSVAIANLPH